MKKILLFFAISINIFAQGPSYSFIIKFDHSKVYVTSPKEITKDLSVIIENNTLGPIWGNILGENSNPIEFLGIPSLKTKSISLKNYKKDQIYYFVPLSPAFQKIILKFDRSSYEIPPAESQY